DQRLMLIRVAHDHRGSGLVAPAEAYDVEAVQLGRLLRSYHRSA
ncbi:MAG: hypothetical protein ACJA0V_003413, partial [Planctomycetota bacterium]